MRISGIDYSMSCPAITTFDSGNNAFNTFFLTDTKKYQKTFVTSYEDYEFRIVGSQTPTIEEQIQKFEEIGSQFTFHATGSELVILEGYAYSAVGNLFQIGENTGILKYMLSLANTNLKIVQPTTIKKYAAGKGNAKKPDMYNAFVAKTAINLVDLLGYKAETIKSPIADIVDSYFMCMYGVEIQQAERRFK